MVDTMNPRCRLDFIATLTASSAVSLLGNEPKRDHPGGLQLHPPRRLYAALTRLRYRLISVFFPLGSTWATRHVATASRSNRVTPRHEADPSSSSSSR